MKPEDIDKKVFCPFPWIQYQVESSEERLCCVSKKTKGYALDKNTEVKKKVRLQMMNGERPDECSYCYDIEDKGGWSLRQTMLSKTGPRYSIKNIITVTDSSGYITSEPDTFNIWVGNICNLACVTCNPEISSKWIQDKDILAEPVHAKGRFDGVKLNVLGLNIWGDVPQKLMLMGQKNKAICLHMAGGEPLMDKKALAIIDFLVESELCKKTNLILTTNGLFIDNHMIERFRHFLTATISLSVDAVGIKNDYIRYGSRFDQIEEVVKLMEKSGTFYRFSHTISALSASYFSEFYEWSNGKELAISWVSMPDYMTMESLPQGMLDKIAQENPVSSHHASIIEYAKTTKNVPEYTEKLKLFLERNDAKRGVDHKSVYPEICEFLY